MTLNEYLPLKQGLRPAAESSSRTVRTLNEYLPLKQGLRLTTASANTLHNASMSIFH